jgi:hypothetical protein
VKLTVRPPAAVQAQEPAKVAPVNPKSNGSIATAPRQGREVERPVRIPERWGISAAAFLDGLALKPIRLKTIEGRLYSGRLVGADRYDLVVEIDGVATLVPKHAIILISEACEVAA